MANIGRLTYHGGGTWGGGKFVFVKSTDKPAPIRATNGMVIKNPFKYNGMTHQGDFAEYTVNGEGYLLKVFKAAKAVGATDTELWILNDGRSHQPEVGNIVMKAPTTLAGTGTAGKINSVEVQTENGKEYFVCGITAASIGTIAIGDILVEAEEAGAGKSLLVKNPNSFLDVDYNFPIGMNVVAAQNIKYTVSPILHETAWIERMSYIPAFMNTRNKSLVTGWFEL